MPIAPGAPAGRRVRCCLPANGTNLRPASVIRLHSAKCKRTIFPAQRCYPSRDSAPAYRFGEDQVRGSLRCGISVRPMTALGHLRPTVAKPHARVRPLHPKSGLMADVSIRSALCRYCCKSPKLSGDNFPAVRRFDRRPPIYVVSITLPRSPVSLSSGDEVPHIFTRKSRLKPGEFLITSAKRLLQQYLPIATLRTAENYSFIRSPCRHARPLLAVFNSNRMRRIL